MYACGTGWLHDPDYEIYDSVERLKEYSDKCWKECGIVRLEITETEWVEEPADWTDTAPMTLPIRTNKSP